MLLLPKKTQKSERDDAAYPQQAPYKQHVGQGCDVSYPEDFQWRLCLWILSLTELLNLSIVLLDRDRHLCDLLEHRTECRRREQFREIWFGACAK